MNKLKKITIIIDGKHADHGYWTGEQIEGCAAPLSEGVYQAIETAIEHADNESDDVSLTYDGKRIKVAFEDRNQCFYDQCAANADINEPEPMVRRYVAGSSVEAGWKYFCIECAECFDNEADEALENGPEEYHRWNGGYSHLTGSELEDPDDEAFEAQQLIDSHGFGMESLGPVACITATSHSRGLRIYDDQESAITTLQEIKRACEAVDHGNVEAFWQHFFDI